MRRRHAVVSLAIVVLGMALPVTVDGATRKRAAKPVLTLEAKLPAPGKVGLLHAVFTVKRPKGVTSKLGVRARLLNKGRLPASALVLLRVGERKGKRNTYTADLIVANAKAAAAAPAAAGAFDLAVAVNLPAGSQFVNRGAVTFTDVAGDEPDHPNLCAPAGDFAKAGPGSTTELFDPAGLAAPVDWTRIFDGTEQLACDRPLAQALRSLPLFHRLDLPPPPPPTCTGSLLPAPDPYDVTEFEIKESCTAEKSAMLFLMPPGTTLDRSGLVIIATFSGCEVQSRAGEFDNALLCEGNPPAGRVGHVRVRPNVLPCGKVVRIFPGGGPFGALPPAPAVGDAFAFDTTPLGCS